MCGVAALWTATGCARAERERIVGAMCDLMAHRGPDGAGVYSDEAAGLTLGHRRLAILDLSEEGRQPMRRGPLWVSFNGEIYNYVELREPLSAMGERFRSGSDTEVLLASFARYGEGAPERWNGMFALLLWDQAERRLHLVRDRFGVKPLYYLEAPGVLIAASEPKAVLYAAGELGLKVGVDGEVLSLYLADAGLEPGDRTFFDRVRRVHPGELRVYGEGARPLRARRYYELTPERCGVALDEPERAPLRAADPAARSAADERFLELFTDAIRLRFRSDVKVGTCLSGGLDSSSIVCAAALRLSQRVEAFSAVYGPGEAADESRYIDEVARVAGVRSHRVDPTARFGAEALLRFIALHDEPIGGTSVWAQHCVFRLAREHGAVVMLDGQGADEVLTGYHGAFRPLFAELLLAGSLPRLWGELRAAQRLHGYGAPRGVAGALWSLLSGPLRARAPGGEALWRRYLARKWRGFFTGTPWFRVDVAPLPEDLPQAAAWGRRSLLHRYLYELAFGSSLQSILRYEDRNSMAASIEARAPFLDYRLVEHCFAQRPERLVQEGYTKALLRRSLRGLLPESVRLRVDKIGFATPEPRWLAGPLRPYLEDLLADPRVAQRGWFRVPVLRAALQRLGEPGAVDHGTGTSAESAALWKLLNTELWLRHHRL